MIVTVDQYRFERDHRGAAVFDCGVVDDLELAEHLDCAIRVKSL